MRSLDSSICSPLSNYGQDGVGNDLTLTHECSGRADGRPQSLRGNLATAEPGSLLEGDTRRSCIGELVVPAHPPCSKGAPREAAIRFKG